MSGEKGNDPVTMQAGLLMESAQAHQALAEEQIRRLHAHTRDLDAVVRAEIRRTLLEEMQALSTEARNAVQALQRIRRAAGFKSALVGAGMLIAGTALPIGIVFYTTPSAAEIQRLRDERAALSANVIELEQRGGRAELRQCGDARRLCVRVDRKAPAYGEHADMLVIKGY